MTIFDPHIRSETQSEDSLRHLSYFGTRGVVTAACGHRSFENAARLIEYFDELIEVEKKRLARCGLEAWVALGVTPDMEPRRAHGRVWPALRERLQRPEVVALGEVGVWRDEASQWRLFERQVEIAKEIGPLPIWVTPPQELKINMTYKMMNWLERAGYPPSKVVMGFLNEQLLKNVVASGFNAGFPLGASANPPRRSAPEIAAVVQEFGAENILLTSSLRAGAGDVLGLPKAVEALTRCGVEQPEIDRMVRENAAELFLGDATWIDHLEKRRERDG